MPTLRTLVLWAGIGQIILIVGSLAIPRILKWGEELTKVKPLIRQMFWVYSAYIWGTNLCFGLLSALAPDWLVDRSPLAGVVSAFICAYWGARVIIQFTYFDRSDVPAGLVYRFLEGALVALFLFLTLVYGAVAVTTFKGSL